MKKLVLLSLVVLLTAACTQNASPPAVPEVKEAEPEHHASVPTIVVSQTQVTQKIAFPGIVAALPDHSISVAPNIAGKIGSVTVVPGDRVTRGQVIATLDSQQLRAQLDQAAAPQMSAVSALHQAEVALDVAQKNLERTQSLFNKDVVAQKDVIAAQNQVDLAKAQLEFAKAHIQELKAAPQQVMTQLRFTKVRSPISGIVSDRYRNVGDAADPNTPIVHVVDLATVVIRADLPADSPAHPSVGNTATVTDVAEPGTAYSGTIIATSPVVNQQSYTFPVEIKVVNSSGRLKEGQAVTVSIANGMTTAVLVPKSALVPGENDASGQFVYKVSDGKLTRVHVKTGETKGDQVAIMDGLKAGDEVAVSGMYGLPDGTILERSVDKH